MERRMHLAIFLILYLLALDAVPSASNHNNPPVRVFTRRVQRLARLSPQKAQGEILKPKGAESNNTHHTGNSSFETEQLEKSQSDLHDNSGTNESLNLRLPIQVDNAKPKVSKSDVHNTTKQTTHKKNHGETVPMMLIELKRSDLHNISEGMINGSIIFPDTGVTKKIPVIIFNNSDTGTSALNSTADPITTTNTEINTQESTTELPTPVTYTDNDFSTNIWQEAGLTTLQTTVEVERPTVTKRTRTKSHKRVRIKTATHSAPESNLSNSDHSLENDHKNIPVLRNKKRQNFETKPENVTEDTPQENISDKSPAKFQNTTNKTSETETDISTTSVTESTEISAYDITEASTTVQEDISTMLTTHLPRSTRETADEVPEKPPNRSRSSLRRGRFVKVTRTNHTLAQDHKQEFSTNMLVLSSNNSLDVREGVETSGHRGGSRRVVKMVRRIPNENHNKRSSESQAKSFEKEVTVTGVLNFEAPRRKKKLVKVTRKNITDPETTTKSPVTLVTSAGEITVTSDVFDRNESGSHTSDYDNDIPSTVSPQGTVTSIELSTALSSQSPEEIHKESPLRDTESTKHETLEHNTRRRGRYHKRILRKHEETTSTTKTTLGTKRQSEERTDTSVGETTLPSTTEHKRLQKRSADDTGKTEPKRTSYSSISDPTRNYRFVSGASKNSRKTQNQVYSLRQTADRQADISKYRNKNRRKVTKAQETSTLKPEVTNESTIKDEDFKVNVTFLAQSTVSLNETEPAKITNIQRTTEVYRTVYSPVAETTTKPNYERKPASPTESYTIKRSTSLQNITLHTTELTDEKYTSFTKQILLPTNQKTTSFINLTRVITTATALTQKHTAPPIPTQRIKTVSIAKSNYDRKSVHLTEHPAVKHFTDLPNITPLSTRQLTDFAEQKHTLPSSQVTSTSLPRGSTTTTTTQKYSESLFVTQRIKSTARKPISEPTVDVPTKRASQQVVTNWIAKATPQPPKSTQRKGIVAAARAGEESFGSTITDALTSRAYKVLAAVQQVAGAVFEIPKQLWLLPVRFGLYPGIQRTQDTIPSMVKFPCQKPQEAGSVPTSVHRLRPQDIKVVAAMGDSITSANGAMANNEEETRYNYRGVSAMGGGQGTWRRYLTVPNIIKEFNPKLLGYALGTVETNNPISGLNVAENGAVDDQLLHQAQSLVRKMREDRFIQFEEDWKLINILIGGNDLCNEYCYQDNDKDSPSGHRRQLEDVLIYLKKNVPRAFVNLIHIPNLLLLQNMKNLPFVCHLKQLVLCSCLFGGSERIKGESVMKMLQGYWHMERQVSEDERFDEEDFTVVLQPFFLGVESPETVTTLFGEVSDLSYFAPDCFHFSQKGNAQVANALWNNMMEPVGNKTYGWEPLMRRFICPSLNAPYFFTRRNTKTFIESGHQ